MLCTLAGGRTRDSHTDVLIIGAGHNGLTCAAYLAGAGLSVRVLERRAVVGGAAVTEEFHPGFRNSTASYTVSLLNPRVIRDLRLAEHGLRVVPRPYGNFLPLPDGRALRFGGAGTREAVSELSSHDAAALDGYWARLDRVAALLKDWVLRSPPQLGGVLGVRTPRDALVAARLLWQAGQLGLEGQRDLVRLFTASAGHWLDEQFESDAVKAVLGWDSVVGNYASPYAAGSAYVLLHHCIGEVNGVPGQWGHAIGGMGAITQAMAAEARARGVQIELEAPVTRVLVEQGAATGVELADGRVYSARAVASNLNPRLLYERLVPPEVLPENFRRAIAGYRCGSGALRINVALAELPDFRVAPGTEAQPHHASGILFAPSLGYMDAAWRSAREQGYAARPIVEMMIPSVIDETLAPRGAHVASLFCQHFDPEADWQALKPAAVKAIFDVVEQHCPNFRRALLGYRALSPLDLEREFGLVGGDIFHGQLSLDQLFSMRPLLGYARYQGPVRGLWHCGSGAHPGGGVTGAPGHNAAREMIRVLG